MEGQGVASGAHELDGGPVESQVAGPIRADLVGALEDSEVESPSKMEPVGSHRPVLAGALEPEQVFFSRN